MASLFSCAGRLSPDARRDWSDTVGREFFDGDSELEDDVVGLGLEKALAYPFSLTRLKSQSPIAFRRGWTHIRRNQVGMRVLSIVVKGSLKIVRAQGAISINAGQAGIIESDAPFRLTVDVEQSEHDSFHVLIPAHIFMQNLQNAERLTKSFSLISAKGKVVHRVLDVLWSEGDNLGRSTAEALAASFLQAVREAIGRDEIPPRRQTLADKRLADIENYILMNLTDSELTFDKVAASCGISPRYMCYLLKANNTSFSDLVWKNRLPRARDWLVTLGVGDYPIHEIAFMSGFKSAAHFSRMFKVTYGCSPREYRARHASGKGARDVAHGSPLTSHDRESAREAA